MDVQRPVVYYHMVAPPPRTHHILLSRLFPFLPACGLRCPETLDHRADGGHRFLSLLHRTHARSWTNPGRYIGYSQRHRVSTSSEAGHPVRAFLLFSTPLACSAATTPDAHRAGARLPACTELEAIMGEF